MTENRSSDNHRPSTLTIIDALPGRRAELVAALLAVRPSREDEPGLLEYSLHLPADDDDQVWYFARYRDAKAIVDHKDREASLAEQLDRARPFIASASTRAGAVVFAL
jgi:quinol monooxygenase YgiN